MKYKVEGTLMQLLEVDLQQGESVYTESGGMAWMGDGIDMKTDTKGGLMRGLGRALSGESLFMTTYICNVSSGKIVFTPEAPGKILDMYLEPGQSLICQKDSFMCAENSVKMEMFFRKKLGAGLFGGEGFILQKVTGPGMVFLEIPGEVKTYTLGANSHMKVDPGHIAVFEPTVSYDISMVKGVKNILFAGEGLFLASLHGPGQVWLQTMPIANLASKLARYIPSKG
jgi:uncharacterized protein (TIGR00266 family)